MEWKNSTQVRELRLLLALVVSSACGRKHTGSSVPFLTAYFPMLFQGILGEGGLFAVPPLEDYFTGLTDSSIRAGTGCTALKLIGSRMANCQALT